MSDEEMDLGIDIPEDPFMLLAMTAPDLQECTTNPFDEVEDERQTESYDETDFDEGVQREVFLALKDQVRAFVNVRISPRRRWQAAEWLFGRDIPDKHGLGMHMACMALQARPLVVQTRALYQLWRHGITFDKPLPLLSDGLPACLAPEIEAVIGRGAAVRMARKVWIWPGIPVDTLRAELNDVDEHAFNQAFTNLLVHGYLGTKNIVNNVFFISRNPDEMGPDQLRNFSWAKSMLGQD